MAWIVGPRVVHVLAVVAWIGGVGFVTTVLLPAVRENVPREDRVAFFERFERRFAWQARFTTALAGLSGFWMVEALGLWGWFLEPSRWYLHLMVLVWTVFTLMLFVLEPLFLHDLLLARARVDPDGTFERIVRLHRVLFALGMIAAGGAVAGAHGWLMPV
ncbi:MAG: hypothetical protein H6732_05690 [Alphaproteobacteria bacterium]|nr:hypothetical protein [Alphaproteobacteria bacterium]